jgi:Mg-chelatase subunit ChlD
VVDRSGSMGPLRDDAIGGFNTFLADQQKQPGQANLTLVLFNELYDVVHDGKSIQDVQPLTAETYVPQGMTALLDAMGKAINQTGARLAALEEQDRPGKVIVVVLTDGQENSSCEFSKAKISEMVKHQEERYGWKVIFLSSDLNAIRDASTGAHSYANPHGCALYDMSPAGTHRAYNVASRAVASYRSTGNTGDLDEPNVVVSSSTSGEVNKN